MRILFFTCAAALLGACATSPPEAISTGATGLPTSELRPGQCGLFGWTTGSAREFIFYADESKARYAGPDGSVNLIAQSPFPAINYTDSLGQPVTLRLGQGEVMIGGMRYPGARVATLTNEGWERLQPVAIIKTCQPV